MSLCKGQDSWFLCQFLDDLDSLCCPLLFLWFFFVWGDMHTANRNYCQALRVIMLADLNCLWHLSQDLRKTTPYNQSCVDFWVVSQDTGLSSLYSQEPWKPKCFYWLSQVRGQVPTMTEIHIIHNKDYTLFLYWGCGQVFVDPCLVKLWISLLGFLPEDSASLKFGYYSSSLSLYWCQEIQLGLFTTLLKVYP